MNNQGQSIVEASIMGLFLTLLLTSLLALIYICFLKYYTDFFLSESLICVASVHKNNYEFCKKETLKKLNKNLILTDVQNLRIKLHRHFAEAHLNLTLWNQINFKKTKTLALPLRK
jgi:hypothetical protein